MPSHVILLFYILGLTERQSVRWELKVTHKNLTPARGTFTCTHYEDNDMREISSGCFTSKTFFMNKDYTSILLPANILCHWSSDILSASVGHQ